MFQVGFWAGNIDNARYIHPWSHTDAVISLTRSSNFNITGRWMYRVDGANIMMPNTVYLPGMMNV